MKEPVYILSYDEHRALEKLIEAAEHVVSYDQQGSGDYDAERAIAANMRALHELRSAVRRIQAARAKP